MKRGALLKRKVPLARTSMRRRLRADLVLAAARQVVIQRAGGRCEIETPACPPGWHAGCHAHHVRRRSQATDDSPGNLLWVCRAAHDFIHANVAWSYERGFLKRRSTQGAA